MHTKGAYYQPYSPPFRYSLLPRLRRHGPFSGMLKCYSE